MRRFFVAMLQTGLFLAIPLMAEELKLGKPIELTSSTTIKELLSRPGEYLGKDVRIEGEIVEVCQHMGCWINVRDASSDALIQVKVNDGEIVFPKNGSGKQVVVQGRLEKVLVSKEELQRQAIESGKKVDSASITEAKVIYRIKGDGAIVK